MRDLQQNSYFGAERKWQLLYYLVTMSISGRALLNPDGVGNEKVAAFRHYWAIRVNRATNLSASIGWRILP
jgi:hypothetical protein